MTTEKISQIPISNTNPSDTALYETSDGGVSGKVLNTDIGQLRKVGTALIGGDFTGNARGAFAIDIDPLHSSNRVASGDYSLKIGYNARAAGYKAAAFGYSATANGSYALAVGSGASAGGNYSSALGYNVTAGGASSVAIGKKSQAGSDNSVAIGVGSITTAAGVTVIAPPITIPQTTSSFELAGGVEVILMTAETDLKAVADVTLAIPTGAHFWLDEIGIICTAYDTVTVQPIIRFGDNVGVAHQHAAAITTGLTAALKRQLFTPLDTATGLTSLIGGVTVAATATAMKGRYYFKGLLVEDAIP